eukprot:18993-Heterococcus_DN1.PRE.1
MLFVGNLPCEEAHSLQLVHGDRGRRHFQLQAGRNEEPAVARPHIRILPEARARRGLEAKQGGCKHVTSAQPAAPRSQGVKQILSASRKSGYDVVDAGLQLQVNNKPATTRKVGINLTLAHLFSVSLNSLFLASTVETRCY